MSEYTIEGDETIRYDTPAQPSHYTYTVVVTATGAHCLNTDDIGIAINRADALGDAYVRENSSGQHIYAPPATDAAINTSFDAYR